MSYEIHPRETVRESVVRIAREQIGKAIDEIEDDALDLDQTVHRVRRRCKKLRALIRLVRPALGGRTYRAENACFRDAARSLSGLRDAHSQIEALDHLTDRLAAEVPPDFAATVRARLVERGQGADQTRANEPLDTFLETMHDAYQRAGAWTLRSAGFEAVAGGLRNNYRRGRKAMARAYASSDAEAFHEWRKRAKYYGHHLRLLRPLWPAVLKAEGRAAVTLGELLGDEHDLTVLAHALRGTPDAFGNARALEALLRLVTRRSGELREDARLLGQRLFAERPDALVDRFGALWTAWEHESRAEPADMSREAAAG